jgi:hypothetical protein
MPPLHSRSRAVIASESAVCAAVTAGVTRAERAKVTSAMFTDAKPIPAMTASAKVMSQTPQPTSAAAL